MFVGHYLGVEEKEVKIEGAEKTTIIWSISPKVGARNFVIFKKGGKIPIHNHEWEHEIFVVKGEGYITNGRQ